MNKKGNKNNTILILLFILFVIICQIFRIKTIYIEPRHILETSISNIVYPFTFLIIALLRKKNTFDNTHKIIIKTIFTFLIFMFVVTLFNNITPIKNSLDVDIALKKILTPNYLNIGKYVINYPNLLSIIAFILLFYFSHTLIIILIDALEPFTNKYIAYFIAMFIPYTLDVLCFTTIIDVFKEVNFNVLIMHLTSNFILVIVFTILCTLIYGTKKVN